MSTVAEVSLWGETVGALLYDTTSGISTFEYSPDWINSGVALAPLHLPARSGKFSFPGLSLETYRGLPGVFADTLPDDFGNAVINAWLARNGIAQESFSPVDRLLYTSSRGMGALEYQPALNNRQMQTTTDIQVDQLVALAQAVLDQRAGLDVSLADEGSQDAINTIFQVGTSAGGARPKAVVALNESRSRIVSGQNTIPAGFQHYLLKFDGVSERSQTSEVFGDPQGYGRMEYAYFLMARDAGVQISDCELLPEGQRAHFLTKRFDRDGNRKRHYLSLCAMDHADYKKPGHYSYEQLLATARALRLPRADAIEIFRRMVFNVVARNQDDHTKNIGFVLDDKDSHWRLAPAFDVVFSYKPGSPWVDSHQMTINGKRDHFSRQDLLSVAEQIGRFAQQAEAIIEQVTAVVSRWPQYAEQAQVAPALTQHIQSNLRLNL